MTKCPLLFAATMAAGDLDPNHQRTHCMRQDCELWNEHFGRCSLAVDAYIKGNEDYRREKADQRKERQ